MKTVAYHTVGVLVDDRQILSRHTEIETPDRQLVLDKRDREGIVDVDLQHEARSEADEEALTAFGATDDLDVTDDAVEHPLPHARSLKVVELQFFLLT